MNSPSRHVAHLLSVSLYGGPSRVVVNLLGESVRRGWKATLILLEHPRIQQTRLRNEAARAGAEVVTIPARGPVNALAPLRLRALLRCRSVDVLHCHGYKPALYALLAEPGGARRARVATVHGWTAHNARVRLYEALERKILRRFDRVFVVSKDLESQLKGRHVDPRKLVLARNSFDFEAFAPPDAAHVGALRHAWGGPPGLPVVGVLGRLRDEKGQDVFLRALVLLNQLVQGVLVGDGPARPSLESAARELSLTPPPVFAGATDDPLAALAAFDIAVFPSRTEGTPQALIEAMALGKPIVATAVGGMREAIQDGQNGLLVPCDDPPALAGRILRLLENRNWAEKLGERAARRARADYSLQRLGGLIEQHYEDALAERRAANAQDDP